MTENERNECIIYWKRESENSISQKASFCCDKLKHAVGEEGYYASIEKGPLGWIPHFQIGYIYTGEVINECPFCHARIVAYEEI